VVDSISMAANGVGRFTFSESGTLLYWTGQQASDELELGWVTRDGAVTQVDPGWTFDPSSATGNRSWDLSPDGTRIAVKILTDQGPDIWIKELPDGPTSRFTFYEGEDRFPKWTPDGEHLTLLSTRGGNLDVWKKRADGVGEAESLLNHEVTLAEGIWSPDGEWLIVRTGGASGVIGGRDILALRPGVDSVAEPLIATEFDEASPMVSADGRWLAYQSNETGTREVFIRPFPEAGGRKVQVSDGGGRSPVWSHSGDELYYLTEGGGTEGPRDLMVARIRPGPPLAVTETRLLVSLPRGFYFGQNTTSYDVTADDQRFLMARDPRMAEGPGRGELIVVKNFPEEVKRRLVN
jgi:WD40 repeat protein